MPIFEVEVSQTIVVIADDEFDALIVAEDNVNELDWQAYDCSHQTEVTSIADLRHGWDSECIPYGGDGNTRLCELL